MKESIIQKQIIDYLQCLENLGRLYFARVGSGAIKTETGRYFKSGKKGCPDIICVINGYFIGLEIKNEKGKQSDTQREAEKKIKHCCGEYIVIRSLDELMEFLKERITL